MNAFETEYVHRALVALGIDLTRWRWWREQPWACMDDEERRRVREWLAANETYQRGRVVYAKETDRMRKALAETFPLLDAGIATRLAVEGFTPENIVYQDDDDLRAIKGIGPKTLRLIRALYGPEESP